MNEDFPVVPTLIGLLALTYFGFEVQRRRNKLREIFDVINKPESRIAETLEAMVARGELLPYVPGSARPSAV